MNYDENPPCYRCFGLWLITTIILLFIFFVVLWPHRAESHSFYPSWCCSDKDCHPIPDEEMQMENGGWRHIPSGAFIPFEKTLPSPDGRFHGCPTTHETPVRMKCFWAPGAGV